MKTIVIYNSQTGFTKRYAEWIAEAAGAECADLKTAEKQELSAYDAIVFGSWACAGGVSKLSWFKNAVRRLEGKKLIAYCVGASPMESPEVEKSLEKNFKAPGFEGVSAFYCPGGLNYEIMPAPSKFAMNMLIKVLSAKKEKTDEDREMIKMISSSYDISDKKYIEPILEALGK